MHRKYYLHEILLEYQRFADRDDNKIPYTSLQLLIPVDLQERVFCELFCRPGCEVYKTRRHCVAELVPRRATLYSRRLENIVGISKRYYCYWTGFLFTDNCASRTAQLQGKAFPSVDHRHRFRVRSAESENTLALYFGAVALTSREWRLHQ
ncbi:hypothetical protein J6590_055811 [Homalodisca vitripennis]|nr:hypothetical protein J6590_055811 [Homalodisca vitripennis]